MRRGAMSKLADTLTLRVARPEERDELEELQRHASLELPEYRDQLIADPEAIHLPLSQVANGQVIVAEADGEIAGFAAVVGGELDGLFRRPGPVGARNRQGAGRCGDTPGAAQGIYFACRCQSAREEILRALRFHRGGRSADALWAGAEDDEVMRIASS